MHVLEKLILSHTAHEELNFKDVQSDCYNIMKGTEYFVSSQMNVVLTKEYSVMVNSEELIDTMEYLMLQMRRRIN